jgi:hypothetical protein
LNAVYAKTGLRDMHVMVRYSLRLVIAMPGFFVLAYFRERESLFRYREKIFSPPHDGMDDQSLRD